MELTKGRILVHSRHGNKGKQESEEASQEAGRACQYVQQIKYGIVDLRGRMV